MRVCWICVRVRVYMFEGREVGGRTWERYRRGCVDYRLQIARYANHIMHLPSYLSILLIFSFFIYSISDHILCRYTDVDHWTQKGQTKSVDDGFLGFEGKGEESILFHTWK